MLSTIALAPLGAVLLLASTSLALELPYTATTTIPHLGSCTNTLTLAPCNGQIIVVVQTPLVVATCSPTPTTTSTPTASPTPGGACLVNPLCAPAGLNIDYYANPLGGYSSGKTPSSYYITEGLTPKDSSLTNVTFFPQDTPPANLPQTYPNPTYPSAPYYVGWTRATNGGVTVDANNFTLVYQGFYRAPRTGLYTLCATADNQNDVYFGHGNAFDCLSGKAPGAGAVPLLTTTGGNYINGIVCKNVSLTEGLYYPVRNVMGDWQGPSAFNFTIQEPGVAFADRTNDFKGLVYPVKCGLFL